MAHSLLLPWATFTSILFFFLHLFCFGVIWQADKRTDGQEDPQCRTKVACNLVSQQRCDVIRIQLVISLTNASTHFVCPLTDGQVEWARVAWLNTMQMVTRLTTNHAAQLDATSDTAYRRVNQSINHLIRPQTRIKIWQFKWTSEEQERQGYGTLTAARN